MSLFAGRVEKRRVNAATAEVNAHDRIAFHECAADETTKLSIAHSGVGGDVRRSTIVEVDGEVQRWRRALKAGVRPGEFS